MGRGGVEGQYMTLPVSEFDNLHEEIRILRLRVEKLEVLLAHEVGFREKAEQEASRAEQALERLRAVVDEIAAEDDE